jgi:hypothetical protein
MLFLVIKISRQKKAFLLFMIALVPINDLF